MRKILITDDDPISLHVLARYLTEAGIAYSEAQDGQQAWELLNREPQEFLAVISDRIMPKLHGLQLFIKMQAHPLLKHIPVVLLTGTADKKEVIAAVKAGIYDFLYKPIEKELLLAVVKRIMSNTVI